MALPFSIVFVASAALAKVPPLASNVMVTTSFAHFA